MPITQMACWKSRLEAQAQTLADCHRDLHLRDAEKDLRHEQQVTALEREIVMLRASLQVAEATIQRLTKEAEAQRLTQQTLLDGAALLKDDVEQSKRREEWQAEELRRQAERNQALMDVIDTMIRERDSWLAERKEQVLRATTRQEERLQAVTVQVAELQRAAEALQLRVGALQAENGLLRENNTRLVALLQQTADFEDFQALRVPADPTSAMERKPPAVAPVPLRPRGRPKAPGRPSQPPPHRCCCQDHG
eukprot:EG_transcript_18929